MNNILKGIVYKKNSNKTLVVLIKKIIKHKIYNKYIKKNYKINVHDNNNMCKINDYIEIRKCRPISKTKFWILNKILIKSKL